jgi:hypothetical protein
MAPELLDSLVRERTTPAVAPYWEMAEWYQSVLGFSTGDGVNPYQVLHPTPYTLHPTPYTLHPTPYTLHPTPYTLHPAPYTLHPTPYTLHPTPLTHNRTP